MRAARERRGMSGRELARRIGYSHVTVSNWETGKTVPEVAQLGAYLGALGVVGDERAEIEELARGASDPNWLLPGMAEQMAAVLEYERTAVGLFVWSPSVIPGLLQTGDYAHVTLASGRTAAETRAAVLLRLGRSDILTQPKPTQATFVIGEGALRQPLGGPAVLAHVVEHILRLCERDNITVRVLPFSDQWHPGLAGPLVIYRFADESPIVYLEHHRSAAFPNEPADVSAYTVAADTIMAMALDAAQSRRMLTAAAEGEL